MAKLCFVIYKWIPKQLQSGFIFIFETEDKMATQNGSIAGSGYGNVYLDSLISCPMLIAYLFI